MSNIPSRNGYLTDLHKRIVVTSFGIRIGCHFNDRGSWCVRANLTENISLRGILRTHTHGHIENKAKTVEGRKG